MGSAEVFRPRGYEEFGSTPKAISSDKYSPDLRMSPKSCVVRLGDRMTQSQPQRRCARAAGSTPLMQQQPY